MNWEIIEILNQLKDAGLPEPKRTAKNTLSYFINFNTPLQYIECDFYYDGRIGIITDDEEWFPDLPSAIQKLQELLTDKTTEAK